MLVSTEGNTRRPPLPGKVEASLLPRSPTLSGKNVYLKELDWVRGKQGGFQNAAAQVTDCSEGGGAGLCWLFPDLTFPGEYSQSFSRKWATVAQEVKKDVQ